VSADPPLREGLEALRSGRFPEAFAAFRRGAEAGDPEALAYLGLLHLRGLGTDYDPEAACRASEEAHARGVLHAGLTFASLLYGGQGCPPDRARAIEILRATAARAQPAALRILGLLHLGEGNPSGRRHARALLSAAGRTGDAFAVHALALLRLEENDPRRAVPLLVAAARRGLLPARQRLRLFQKEEGEAKTRDLALLPVEIAEEDIASALAAPVPLTRPAPETRVLAEAIGLRRARGVLHPAECDYLLAIAAPFLRPAETTDPANGRPLPTPLRTSLATNLHPSQEDLLTLRIEERILSVLGEDRVPEEGGRPLARCEPLAILHYAPGQEYRPHYDAYPPAALRADDPASRPGQRTHTLLTYLNDACTGGSTAFPRLDLKVAPETGSVVVFRNVSPEGEPLEEALHAGEPVASGEKWLATLWVRERAGARLPRRAEGVP
jgi:prolyl 4-hydroxylase